MNKVVFNAGSTENVLGVLYVMPYDGPFEQSIEARNALIGLYFSILDLAGEFDAFPYMDDEEKLLFPPESGSLLLNFYIIFPNLYKLKRFIGFLDSRFHWESFRMGAFSIIL